MGHLAGGRKETEAPEECPPLLLVGALSRKREGPLILGGNWMAQEVLEEEKVQEGPQRIMTLEGLEFEPVKRKKSLAPKVVTLLEKVEKEYDIEAEREVVFWAIKVLVKRRVISDDRAKKIIVLLRKKCKYWI
jgi:hypothetical protein